MAGYGAYLTELVCLLLIVYWSGELTIDVCHISVLDATGTTPHSRTRAAMVPVS